MVYKDLQRLRKKHQPNTISREIVQNSVTSQIQYNSHPLQEETQFHNNVPTTTQNESINTQHSLYLQAVIDKKSKKSDLKNTNNLISNQKLTNQLTTFISEFKTLIYPLITLLNPLTTLLTSLINKFKLQHWKLVLNSKYSPHMERKRHYTAQIRTADNP
jgi:hypothetical protein